MLNKHITHVTMYSGARVLVLIDVIILHIALNKIKVYWSKD